MDKVLNNSTPGKVAYICRIERFQMDALKIERTQTHFFSDVFTAVVVVVDAKGPYSHDDVILRPAEFFSLFFFL